MNSAKILLVPALVAVGIAAYGARDLVARADEKHPKSSVSITDLAKKKGPKPPSGATYAGIEAHPMVGELELPIRDAQVYIFTVTTKSGASVPVKWAYTQGVGTYLWATAPIQCEDDKTIARGGFVMEIHEDGTGTYALGTRQCPVAHVYGCSFDSHQNETGCGACVWNGTELVCKPL
jgi:hypothetical protein